MTPLPLRLAPEAARVIRDEVTRAGGREVSFLAEVTRSRVIVSPRAVARGNRSAVLAVARDAREGSVMIHNHPSGLLEPSDADLAVAASVYERGIGTAIVTNAADRIYVLRSGEIQLEGDAADLQDGEKVRQAYFGFTEGVEHAGEATF